MAKKKIPAKPAKADVDKFPTAIVGNLSKELLAEDKKLAEAADKIIEKSKQPESAWE